MWPGNGQDTQRSARAEMSHVILKRHLWCCAVAGCWLSTQTYYLQALKPKSLALSGINQISISMVTAPLQCTQGIFIYLRRIGKQSSLDAFTHTHRHTLAWMYAHMYTHACRYTQAHTHTYHTLRNNGLFWKNFGRLRAPLYCNDKLMWHTIRIVCPVLGVQN